MRAIVIGGSLGGLTAALVLRDQGWDVDFSNYPNPLEGRGTGIVVHPNTVRYLVERAGKPIGDMGLPAHRIQYLDTDGSIADEQPSAYRFASFMEVYRGLLDAFGTERYHLSKELAHLDNRGDSATLSLTDGKALAADLVVCADGIRSTGRRILVPDAHPRYAGYVAWRGTVDSAEISGRSASILLDAFTYQILPRGHLLTYAIPGPRRLCAVQLALVSEHRAGRPSHGPAHRPQWFHGRAHRAARIGPDSPCRPTLFGGGCAAACTACRSCSTNRPALHSGDRRPGGAPDGLRAELPHWRCCVRAAATHRCGYREGGRRRMAAGDRAAGRQTGAAVPDRLRGWETQQLAMRRLPCKGLARRVEACRTAPGWLRAAPIRAARAR